MSCNKFDNYWNTYNTINEWIKFSDTKAGIIITIYSVILTILYSNANETYEIVSSSWIYISLTLLSAILAGVSLYYCFRCLLPRVENEKGNHRSVIYFGHITAKFESHESYEQYANDEFADETKFQKQIAEQVYTCSEIAQKKFKNVSQAIVLFFYSLIPLFAAIILYLFKII